MATEVNDYYTIAGQNTLAIAEELGYTKGSALRHLVRAGKKKGVSELEDLKTVRGLLDLRISELETEAATKVEVDEEAAIYKVNLLEMIEDSQAFGFPLNLTGAPVITCLSGELQPGIIMEHVAPDVDPYEPLKVFTVRNLQRPTLQNMTVWYAYPGQMSLIAARYNPELRERYEVIKPADLHQHIDELYRDFDGAGE